MTGTNMLLEDVLAILGRVGTVTLRKGTNDRSGTPGFKADTVGWTCELQIEGYLSPYGHGGGGAQLYLGGRNGSRHAKRRGMSPTEAAQHTLAELEQFLESDDARQCRECYLKWGNHRGEPAPEARIDWS